MALSEWELWACANKMIEQHGADAPIHAAMKADDMLERGDIDGHSVWMQIMHRIDEMLPRPARLN